MIECRICGKRFKQITSSGHLRAHGLTKDQYLEKFPDAPTICDATKKAHSRAMKKRVKRGTHFVPFRDIEGFAQRVHDSHKEGPIEYVCIRCGKTRRLNRYLAERRKFCSNECNAKYIRENPDLYADRNRKISESNKGVTRNAGIIRTGSGPYSRCKGGYRDDIGHYVRSGWEADVCRIFHYHGKEYDYEAYTIKLNDGGNDLYWSIDIVDIDCFLSPGLIEIKGWWDDKSKKKLRLLKEQRPGLYAKLLIIDRPKMKELIKKYGTVIDNWESLR